MKSEKITHHRTIKLIKNFEVDKTIQGNSTKAQGLTDLLFD